MAIARISRSVTLSKEQTVTPGTVSAATVKLVTVTVPQLLPEHFVFAQPSAALAAGVGVCKPYCATAGILTIPFINATGSDVAVSPTLFKIVAI